MQSMDALDPQHFLSGELLYSDVKAYAALGEHRTASEADRKTSEWLMKQLLGFGFVARLAPFRAQTFQLTAARLVADGRPVPCFPLWLPKAGEVRGPVAHGAAKGALKGGVAIMRFPRAAALTPDVSETVQAVIDAGAAAVIGVTQSDSGELTALNVPADMPEWKVPVVLVGPAEAAGLTGASGVAITIEGREELRAEAFNAIAEIGSGEKRFVISTPSSGWFHCAGERGPGIAIWLALARWASHRESNARYTFVATSGHEIGEIGMRQFLFKDAPKPDRVRAWLHLGASIAAKGSTRRLMTNRRDFVPVLSRCFSAIPDLAPQMTDSPAGELAQLATLKYPCFGIAGGHRLFHSPGDLPSDTSAAMLEPVAQAVLRALVDLEADV
jgi:hypothetical protein